MHGKASSYYTKIVFSYATCLGLLLLALAIDMVSINCGCNLWTKVESAAAILLCRERFETVPYDNHVAAMPNPSICNVQVCKDLLEILLNSQLVLLLVL